MIKLKISKSKILTTESLQILWEKTWNGKGLFHPIIVFFILYSNKENNKLAIKQLWDKHSDGILLLQVSLASISNNIHPMDHNFKNFALNGSFLSIVVVGFLKFEYKKQANSSGEGNCIFEDIIYLRNDQYKLVSL